MGAVYFWKVFYVVVVQEVDEQGGRIWNWREYAAVG